MPKKRIYRILKWFFGIIFGIFLSISAILYFFKDEICQLAIAEANKYLKVPVQVGEVDLAFWGSFPNLSVDFNHVFIQDPTPGSSQLDTLLFTDRIRCQFNPMDLWNENYTIKSVKIDPGVLKLRVDSLGVNNYDIIKSSSDTLEESSPIEMNLEEVTFNKFRFSYINDATAQEYTTYIDEMDLTGGLSEEVFTAQATSKLRIISAKSGNVTLVRNQPAQLNVGVNVNTTNGTVDLPTSTIYIAKLPFNFNGHVDSLGFNFELIGKNIGIKDAANSLALNQTESVKEFSGNGILLFDLKIEGKNEATTPVEVECQFGVNNGSLTDPTSGITLSKLLVDGIYSNVGGPDKEHLHLKDVRFQTKGGPFRGNLMLTHFEEPLMRGNVNGLLNLSVVHSLFNLNSLQQLNGTVDVSSNFSVQAQVRDDETMDYHINKCEGQMRLNKVNAQLVDDKRVYENINGLVYLRNDNVGMENITLKIGGSDFQLDGVFEKVIDYFSKQGNLVVDAEIHSKRINLADLGAESKEQIVQQERAYILPDNISGHVYMDVKNLHYDGHNFNKLKGNMTIGNRRVHFPKVAVENGGAVITGTVSIAEDKPEIFYISSQLASKNINFKKLFNEWDDFRQDVIKSSNISGDAQANVRFDAPFDLRSGVMMNSIVAQIGLQIDNGRLKDVETFKEITNSLQSAKSTRIAIGSDNIKLLEKKLKDLRFEQMKNTIVIKNGKITIPLMTINSSALNIETSGTHTFDNQIDYRFGFYFRDLKAPEYSEFGDVIDDDLGKWVYMRMYGDLYNPNIAWDKEANKAHRQELRDREKQTRKEILKTIGFYKNDTTVKKYQQVEQPHEELIINFGDEEQIDAVIEASKPKKKGKLGKKFDKWRKEQEAEKEEEFDYDFE